MRDRTTQEQVKDLRVEVLRLVQILSTTLDTLSHQREELDDLTERVNRLLKRVVQLEDRRDNR